MEAEELKVIAEGMGYSILENLFNQWTVTKKEWSYYCKYEPDTTNDAQCMEIIIKFQPSIDWINKDLCQVTIYAARPKSDYIRAEYEGRGKTINEAVCNAAYEHFKENK